VHYFTSLTIEHSVPSSQWGAYKGTLIGVSHLDLINWTNRLKWMFYELTGKKHSYVDALLITISDISNADVALMPWHSILTLQVSQEPVTYKACADEFADMLAKEGL